MTIALKEARLPVSLQTLFCTKVGKKALAEFLTSTGICTANWYNNRATKGLVP